VAGRFDSAAGGCAAQQIAGADGLRTPSARPGRWLCRLADRLNVAIAGGIIILAVLTSAVDVLSGKFGPIG
jgi:hypothetical protein